MQKEQKTWDKVLLVLFFIEFLIWFVIMPLDGRRYGWTHTNPFGVRVAGMVFLLVGFYVLFLALRENTFAAPVVKLQKERGQHVISTGPYALVRHPMYGGALGLFIGGPMLLSSDVGLMLGFALIVTLFIRIIGEEAMLKEELPGYREYMQQVRCRMIPFLFDVCFLIGTDRCGRWSIPFDLPVAGWQTDYDERQDHRLYSVCSEPGGRTDQLVPDGSRLFQLG